MFDQKICAITGWKIWIQRCGNPFGNLAETYGYFKFLTGFTSETSSVVLFQQCWNLGCPRKQMISATETY